MVERIISGGQSGVDRAALDAAIATGIKHGGWCPKGRRAEDGTIPAQYDLQETESSEYPVRTELNVLHSDGTLILYRRVLVGGSELTRKMAERHRKPYYLQDLEESHDVEKVHSWIHGASIRVLNIAGPRESTAPGIQREVFDFLMRLLAR